MDQDLVMAYGVHESVDMYIAVRLLHMINFHTHTLQLMFDLFISASVASHSGGYDAGMSVHPHSVSSFEHAVSGNGLQDGNAILG